MPDNTQDPYAPTTWGKPQTEDFTTPSGQRCLIQKITLEYLMESNLLNQVDFLTKIVDTEHAPRAQKPVAAQKKNSKAESVKESEQFKQAMKTLGNEKDRKKFMSVIDDLVLYAIVKPDVQPVPPEGEERVEGRIYIDSIGLNDRLAIFNEAMKGVGRLETFRAESDEPVGALESGEIIQGSAKSNSGSN